MTRIMTGKKGQVLVELALVFPFLMLFVFSIFDFSRWMFYENTVNHAAGAGARAAAVMTNPAPTPVTSGSVAAPNTPVEQAINQNLFNDSLRQQAAYDLQIVYAGGRATGPAQSGDLVHVTVRWPNFQMLNPMVRALYSPNLTADVTMRYE